MPDTGHSHVIKTLGVHEPETFALLPDAEARAALANELGIRGVRKLSFKGEVRPLGNRDLELQAMLGATVVQDCVVSGSPVVTRIDEPVERRYLDDLPQPTGDEEEMPEDENADPLPVTLDLAALMSEALALALPSWPRAEDVDFVDLTVTEPGKTPMTDDDTKPFAALKALAEKPADDPDGGA